MQLNPLVEDDKDTYNLQKLVHIKCHCVVGYLLVYTKCMCVCMCVCVCMYLCMCVYVSMYVFVYVCVCMYLCIYVYVFMYKCVCMYNTGVCGPNTSSFQKME